MECYFTIQQYMAHHQKWIRSMAKRCMAHNHVEINKLQ